MDVFDAFQPQAVTLILRVSGVGGDTLGTEYSTTGVLKQREGMAKNVERDTRTGDGTLYIRPDDRFVTATDGRMVGHYAKLTTGDLTEQLYQITSASEGKDQDTGEVRHYRLDLARKEATCQQNSVLV